MGTDKHCSACIIVTTTDEFSLHQLIGEHNHLLNSQ